MVDRADYDALMLERPRKFTPDDVAYQPAPKGSELRCCACRSYFRRSIDGLTTCEVMRSDETDIEGVQPDWRCQFFTVDGDVFPLLEDE